MSRALLLALEAAGKGEVPVGAIVVSPDGEILSQAHNLRETNNDPTAHAEILALRSAANKLESWRLIDCTMYVTLEPCPMCVGAAVNARLSRLVYACRDPKAGAVDSLYTIANDSRLNHRIDVTSGVLEEQAAYLLKQFFQNLRRFGNGATVYDNRDIGEMAEWLKARDSKSRVRYAYRGFESLSLRRNEG